jgi:hypothetical protein
MRVALTFRRMTVAMKIYTSDTSVAASRRAASTDSMLSLLISSAVSLRLAQALTTALRICRPSKPFACAAMRLTCFDSASFLTAGNVRPNSCKVSIRIRTSGFVQGVNEHCPSRPQYRNGLTSDTLLEVRRTRPSRSRFPIRLLGEQDQRLRRTVHG